MTTNTANTERMTLIQRLDELKKMAHDLTQRRATIEARITSARQQYQEKAREARERYGTDNIDQLRAKAIEMRRRNEELVSAFAASLKEIEKQIIQAEEHLSLTAAAAPAATAEPMK